MKALVVEDMTIWQEAMQEILTDSGYEVLLASSRDDALSILSAHDVRLTIIDPVLDDTNRHNRDGLRVLQDILLKYPHMRMIVMTSSDPRRIRSEVEALSLRVPILWKDEWDDNEFLSVLRGFFPEKEA